jgi:enediyne biosynthesis protein E4
MTRTLFAALNSLEKNRLNNPFCRTIKYLMASATRIVCSLSLLAAGLPALAEVFSVQSDEKVLSMLEQAAAEQTRAARNYKVLTQFQFADKLLRSGITFEHKMTHDSGRSEKAVHYDHGSGVAIADVDGDGLPDIYFVNQIGANQLWRNLGGAKFSDITATAGVALEQAVKVAAAFADLDNDGDPDLVVTAVRDGNHLLRNDGKGKF